MSDKENRARCQTSSLIEGPSLVVLPLICVGDVSEVEYLADGITEELREDLSRIEGLAVIGRQSSIRYRSITATIEEIFNDLGARFILSGSVRRSEDALRVAADLCDAEDASQMWADTFHQALSVAGILEIESSITRSVLAAISDRLGMTFKTIRRETRGRPPKELSAYEASFRFYHYNTVHGQEAHRLACLALEQAIKDDPEYALAWAQLGELYCDVHALGYEGPAKALERARTCAQCAVDTDNLCQHARLIMAYVQFLDHEHAEVIRQAEMAIALNPNVAHLVGFAGFLIGLSGDPDAGCAIVEETKKLNPYQPGWMRLVAIVRHLDRDEYDAALAEANRHNFPQLAWDPLLRSATAALAGRTRESAAAFRELEELFPEVASEPKPYIRAFIHEDAHVAKLVRGLETARRIVTD